MFSLFNDVLNECTIFFRWVLASSETHFFYNFLNFRRLSYKWGNFLFSHSLDREMTELFTILREREKIQWWSVTVLSYANELWSNLIIRWRQHRFFQKTFEKIFFSKLLKILMDFLCCCYPFRLLLCFPCSLPFSSDGRLAHHLKGTDFVRPVIHYYLSIVARKTLALWGGCIRLITKFCHFFV